MLFRIAAAATATFLLALRVTLAVFWAAGVLVISLISRLTRRWPEEQTRDLTVSLEGWQVLRPLECPECQTTNDETALICYQCGARLPDRRQASGGLQTPHLMGIAVFVLLILVFMVLASL